MVTSALQEQVTLALEVAKDTELNPQFRDPRQTA